MPPATKAARPKIEPPKGASRPTQTPQASTRRGAPASKGATADADTSAAAAKLKADASSSAAAKPKADASSSAAAKPKAAKGKAGKKRHSSKMTRAERLAEEEEAAVDYGTEGGWNIEKWVDSMQLHKLVAEVLSEGKEDDQPYEHAKALTKEEISRRLGAAKLDGLTDAIWGGVEMLHEQSAATGDDLNKKFHMDGAGFEMSFGSLDLFFGGLEGVIGPPRMTNGSLLFAMRDEHTRRTGVLG